MQRFVDASSIGWHNYLHGDNAGANALIKRDNQVKDTGKVFGAHGGVLDRLDAVFFTIVTAYYVSLAVL